jgi:acetate---CoA ligase (ADP-forming)
MAASAAESQKPLVRDVLLRDGWTLRLQAPTPVDYDEIKAFYDGLSPESRYFRFHGFGRTNTVARADAEASGVDRLTLIGRHAGRVVAVAGYDGLLEPGVAEVAFAVADDDQGRGIGTRMLEQLAAIAAGRGIHRFDAEVMANNRPMLGVFEDAGFAVRRRGWVGELTVSLDITPTEAVLARIDERDHVASVASLRPILAPSSVAVVGAADVPGNIGRVVLENIIAGRFQGVVRPVNRSGGNRVARRRDRAATCRARWGGAERGCARQRVCRIPGARRARARLHVAARASGLDDALMPSSYAATRSGTLSPRSARSLTSR